MGFVCTECHQEVAARANFCPYCGVPAPAPEPQPQRPLEAGDSLIGRTIAGRYFVSRLVGRGGMGQVYRANDVALDREVALKVLDRSLLSDPTMVQRFQREGRAASRLKHPNCITILDVGQAEDGTLFIAMEYLAGRPLSRFLADEAPVDADRAVRIVAQILAALADAHASGIVHRDLKPSNVMIETRRDEPDFVKVLDFGLAKLTGAGQGAPQLTGSGIVCGTPGYMSPEQARCEALDGRSDLYAAGVILYELLSGRLPFDAGTAVGFAGPSAAPIPLRQRRPGLEVAPRLEALVERALSSNRADRPASAEEMRQDLLACRGSAGHDRPTPRPERSSTVVLQAVRSNAPPSGGPARSAPEAPRVVRFDRPAPTAAPREPSSHLPAPGDAAGLRQPTTPLPSRPMAPAPAQEGAPLRQPTTPLPRQPSTSAPRPLPAPAPQEEVTPAARPLSTPAPHEEAPPPSREASEERRTPAHARSGARRARPAPTARRGLGAGALVAFIGGGIAAVALVVYLLVASDPFAAPPAAPDDGVRLNLGGAPGARAFVPPRPVEARPVDGRAPQSTKEGR